MPTNKLPEVKKAKAIYSTQSNSLVEAQYKLEVVELKVLLSVISKITRFDETFKPIALGYKELANLLNIDVRNSHSVIRKIRDNLPSKTVKITNLKNPNDITVTNWCAINTNNNIATFFLDEKLRPHLLNLKNSDGFTRTDLTITNSFKSSYTIRLYMLLKNLLTTNHKSRTFEYSELRRILDIGDKSYKIYGDFKRRVLDSVKKELESKVNGFHISNFTFEYEGIGKPVKKIKFKLKPQQYQELLTFTETSDQLPSILGLDTGGSINQKLQDIGFDDDEIIEINSNYDLQYVQNSLAVYIKRNDKGLVVNDPPQKTPKKYYYSLLKQKVQLSKSEINEIVKIETDRLKNSVKKVKLDAYKKTIQDYALSLTEKEVQQLKEKLIASADNEIEKHEYKISNITDNIYTKHFTPKITADMVKANFYNLLEEQGIDPKALPKEINLEIKL